MSPMLSLDEQIEQWRSFLRRRQAIHTVDVVELEDHLREQVANLVDAGLSPDEAFLVAVKRMGALDELSREFAIEHSERLWKQLVAPPADADRAQTHAWFRMDALVAVLLALAAALLFKLPVLFGMDLDDDAAFYARNASLFVLPLLAGYFAWKRRLGGASVRWIVGAFVLATVVANVYPLKDPGDTLALSALHLPIALWLAVGIAYAGARWTQVSGRMDFIRYSGELFIYFVLIALGGGVLTGFTALTFQSIGIDVERFIGEWLIPCGALGAVLIASWLVEAKQSVVENMAPVLTRLFTPLFAAMLLTFLGAVLWTGNGVDVEREVLIAFDLVLVLVVALLVYAISARDPLAPPDLFDWLQVVLIVSALLADLVALWAIAARINEFGFTPNRTAGLAVNVLLLVNLAWSTWLSVRFLRRRGSFASIERWQTDYLYVYAGWAALVVLLFPPLFGFD